MLFASLAALTLVVPNVLEEYSYSGSDGGQHKCRTDLRVIRSALDEYAVRNANRCPEQLDELVAPDSSGYRYLNYARFPLDPWGSPYVYVRPASANARPIVSCRGPDQRAGTDDDLRLVDE